MKRAFLEPHDFDEDAMPTLCEVCGGMFDLDDGSTHPKKDIIICEGCAYDIEQEIEKEEEIEELKNQLSDAEWTVNHTKQQLEKLGVSKENPFEAIKKHSYINPCPMCGGVSDGDMPDVILGALGDSQYRIKCIPCNLSIQQDRVDKVISMWNHRFEKHKGNYADGDL